MLPRLPNDRPTIRPYGVACRNCPRDDGTDERDIDHPLTTFGELLSCLRLAAGVSQRALGHEARVHASYVNRLERGERATPTREVVLALSRSLGATPTERDRLLWLAGHLPVRLQQLGVGDATLATLVQFLTNDALPAEAKDGFRWCVESLAALWCAAGG